MIPGPSRCKVQRISRVAAEYGLSALRVEEGAGRLSSHDFVCQHQTFARSLGLRSSVQGMVDCRMGALGLTERCRRVVRYIIYPPRWVQPFIGTKSPLVTAIYPMLAMRFCTEAAFRNFVACADLIVVEHIFFSHRQGKIGHHDICPRKDAKFLPLGIDHSEGAVVEGSARSGTSGAAHLSERR